MLSIIRLGHRIGRDARLSTHCGLAARALGADEIIYSGEYEKKMINNIKDVTNRWGGPFKARYHKNWRKIIKQYREKRFIIIHMSMYGLPIKKQISKIRKNKNILVIVGSEKVPAEVYHLADYNIAVTNQPHSEVAALSIFLHEYFKSKELDKKFKKAKIRIVPQPCGKKVIENR